MVTATTTTSATRSRSKATLYERMGGDIGIQHFMESLYEKTLQDEVMKGFFQHTPISVLISHHLKLHRVLFGPEEERPHPDAVVNYMLVSHTRIFEDMGLNETHFDTIATCFVEGLESMQADQDVIDECMAILAPLREVFAYGAKVAAASSSQGKDSVLLLPEASAKTMRANDDPSSVRLPRPASLAVPDWLPETLSKHSKESNVRAWTCALTTEFGEDGDAIVADTFLTMPFLHHHIYTLVLLQLAFLPKGWSSEKRRLLQMIKYPQGDQEAPLCLPLWNRMIAGFVRVAQTMSLDEPWLQRAINKLQSHGRYFPDVPQNKRGGVDVPHWLTGEISYFSVVERAPITRSKSSLEELGGANTLLSSGAKDKSDKRRSSQGGKMSRLKPSRSTGSLFKMLRYGRS